MTDPSARRPDDPVVVSVSPSPDPGALAAIVAAVHELWPRPQPAEDTTGAVRSAWRFSGRWWAVPATARRDRPWARR